MDILHHRVIVSLSQKENHGVTFPKEINDQQKFFLIQIIKVRKQGRKNDASKEFKIRCFKAEQSLNWLKNNSPDYSLSVVTCINQLRKMGN